MMRRALMLAVLVAAAGGASARADERLPPERIPQKARELAEQGRAFHDAGEYLKAVAAFKEAYVLAPSPGLLFDIAQAYRLSGDCDDAAWMYRRFLDTNPAEGSRALAEQHLANVEKCGHGGLLVISPPALEVNAPAAQPPLPVPVAVDDAPSGTREKRLALWVGIGGGVALAGAAVFAIDANDASNKVTSLYQHGGKGADVAAEDSRGQRSATLAKVLGVGGGLAVIGAGVLYAVGHHYEAAQHVAIAPHAHGAEVSLAWQF